MTSTNKLRIRFRRLLATCVVGLLALSLSYAVLAISASVLLR